jgi:hypothetical protein
METDTQNETHPAPRTARALELVREAERVLREMNADLARAEAKLAETREMIARRHERIAADTRQSLTANRRAI